MRKSTKLAILVAALVALCSLTAMAKGWTNEGGAWYWVDSNGDYVTSCWKADGANYYYLGEEGEMLTNQLVEDGENTFYVGADGARVANTWIQVEADDADAELGVDYRWYYFQANGKAYKNAKNKTINGQKYTFDEDGKMVFGFVDSNCDIINDKDDAPLYATYYYNSNDDGSLYKGWLKWTEGFTVNDYDSKEEIWFYFDEASAAGKIGKKAVDIMDKKINGQKYSFDYNGVMESSWQTGTNSTNSFASNSKELLKNNF